MFNSWIKFCISFGDILWSKVCNDCKSPLTLTRELFAEIVLPSILSLLLLSFVGSSHITRSACKSSTATAYGTFRSAATDCNDCIIMNQIDSHALLDGGDVLYESSTNSIYVGLSHRTNVNGINNI